MQQDIKDYIEDNIPDLKGRLFPLFTTDLKSLSITYAFTDVYGGHLKQSQIALKIIWSDYDICKSIAMDLKKLLDMDEDAPYRIYGNTRFRSTIAGGGTLYNDGCQMYEDTLYFMIDWRNINGN